MYKMLDSRDILLILHGNTSLIANIYTLETARSYDKGKVILFQLPLKCGDKMNTKHFVRMPTKLNSLYYDILMASDVKTGVKTLHFPI